jgi:hypothetical protein
MPLSQLDAVRLAIRDSTRGWSANRLPALGWTRASWHALIATNQGTLIYRRTGNLRAVQLLLGHKKIESTVRYLGIEVDDALAIAEQVDV